MVEFVTQNIKFCKSDVLGELHSKIISKNITLRGFCSVKKTLEIIRKL